MGSTKLDYKCKSAYYYLVTFPCYFILTINFGLLPYTFTNNRAFLFQKLQSFADLEMYFVLMGGLKVI